MFCRYRHDLYWSLRMRVCRLCMASNSISGEELGLRYGVDCSEMLVKHKGEFFFYHVYGTDDRLMFDKAHKANIQTYLFWLPHLTFLDLPSLFKANLRKKEAAKLLSSVFKRSWLFGWRKFFAKKSKHIDCLLLTLYRNEKKRGDFKFIKRNGSHFSRLIVDYDDSVV